MKTAANKFRVGQLHSTQKPRAQAWTLIAMKSATTNKQCPISNIRTVIMLALMMLVGAIGTLTALGASTVGSFEIEGNLADDSGPGEPIDWATPPPNLGTFTDTVGSNDDVFGQGSKELEPAGWTCVTGSVPSKDDIKDGAISARLVDGKQYLYINFRRAGVDGDAHIDVARLCRCPEALRSLAEQTGMCRQADGAQRDQEGLGHPGR